MKYPIDHYILFPKEWKENSEISGSLRRKNSLSLLVHRMGRCPPYAERTLVDLHKEGGEGGLLFPVLLLSQ